MNIFWLSNDPSEIPQWMVDKHAANGKMALEAAQLMANCYTLQELASIDCPRTLSGSPRVHTHVSNPCSLWTKASISNFEWLLEHANAILLERKHRVGKDHAIRPFLEWVASNKPSLPNIGLTSPALNVTDKTYSSDPVEVYRHYYRVEKVNLHKWTNRPRPSWL